MSTMSDPIANDFSLTPQARRQRVELMDAMQTLQSAVHLLCQRQSTDVADMKTRSVITASQQSLAKLKNYVEQSFHSTQY